MPSDSYCCCLFARRCYAEAEAAVAAEAADTCGKDGTLQTIPSKLQIADWCHFAVQRNHCECLQTLFDQRYDQFVVPDILYDLAVYTGSLECLIVLCENDKKAGKRTFRPKTSPENDSNGQKKIPCFDFEHNIRTNSEYLRQRRPCYRYLLEECGWAVEDHHECVFEAMFGHEEWFQAMRSVRRYLATGEGVDRHTLRIHHRVQRIQHAWIKYAYHPNTPLGRKRMMGTVDDLMQLCILP